MMGVASAKVAKHARFVREQLGFDKAHVTTNDAGRKYVHVGCSQCQAVCVNGVALHEKGCPNERFPKEDDD